MPPMTTDTILRCPAPSFPERQNAGKAVARQMQGRAAAATALTTIDISQPVRELFDV